MSPYPEKTKQSTDVYFQVDWFDYKTMLRDTILRQNPPKFNSATNKRKFVDLVTNSGSWVGFTSGQLERWISDGYTPPKRLTGLGDNVRPVREKRRVYRTDDGDSFEVDLALAGEELFMTSVTKVEAIPGLRVEASIMFAGGISADIVNAYIVWICEVLYSLELSGIDCQLLLDFPSRDAVENQKPGTTFHHLIRVKRENEISDFQSWSAMISPAAMRNFGFGLIPMHADKLGSTSATGLGRGMRDFHEWRVDWDNDRQVLKIRNPYMGNIRFDADSMTRQFKSALAASMGH